MKAMLYCIKGSISKKIRRASFHFDGVYNIIAIFTNPFYLIRRNLYNNISDMSGKVVGKVLDFGCGSKPYTDLFTNCVEYIGCDIKNSGHDHVNETIDVYYDGDTLPFKDAEFDYIFSSEVFEHIFNLEHMLQELNRVLKQGGEMLVTVPFVWNEHEIPYDFGRYTSFGIVDMLKRNGFEIIEQRKSTKYIEALATMFAEYIRYEFAKHTNSGFVMLLVCMVFIAPVSLVGLCLNKLLPENDSWYCNNIIRCTKIKEMS